MFINKITKILTHRLFVTFNYQLTTLDMKVEKRDKVMSHERPVTDAVYNPSTNQVSLSKTEIVY